MHLDVSHRVGLDDATQGDDRTRGHPPAPARPAPPPKPPPPKPPAPPRPPPAAGVTAVAAATVTVGRTMTSSLESPLTISVYELPTRPVVTRVTVDLPFWSNWTV